MRTEPRSDWRSFSLDDELFPSDEREECTHEDFTENQEGDRTCTACGLTTDAPEPGHPNGCICATCSEADLTADND